MSAHIHFLNCTGKTHDALEDFYNAGSGMYLAPLRLLALEIQEMSLARGINCSLTTGEEKDIRGARYIPEPAL